MSAQTRAAATATKAKPSARSAVRKGPEASRRRGRCACGGIAGPTGECESCRQHRLRRNSALQPTVAIAETLRAPGRPLEPGVRRSMEQRFEHDFSRVRVHDDARSRRVADGIGANAFTVGRHIVMGSRGAVGGDATNRVLAHELAHTIQQSQHDARSVARVEAPSGALEREARVAGERIAEGGRATVSGRGAPALAADWDWGRAGLGALTGGAIGGIIGGVASIFLGPAALLIGLGVGALAGLLIGGLTGSSEPESTATVEEPTGPNDCRLAQHRKIFPAVQRSLAWVRSALTRLRAFIARPDEAENQPVRQQLQRHFRAATPDVSAHVAGRLQRIHDDMTTRQNFTVECHGATDTSCNASSAYVTGAQLVFCPAFFRSNDGDWHAESLIHEWAHALNTGVHITDRAYSSDRLYNPALARGITTAEALTNAESYAVFTRELATGRQVSVGGPQDRVAGCGAAGERAIRSAVARAQRVNRNAQVATADARPNWLAGWTDLQNTHLGGTTAAHIARARRVYDAIESRLDRAVDVGCDTDAARCTANYRIDDGKILLCPAWFGLGEPARVTAVLEAMYEAHGGVANAGQRAGYAGLARDLTNRFWPAPALATVIAGGT